MPFKGFTCEATGENTATETCLQCARDGALEGCPMTAPIIAGMLAAQRPDDFGLTVTTLLGCPRKARLKIKTDYYLKPSELWWAYRGQLLHGVAADYSRNDAQAITETRLEMMMDVAGRPLIITGQPDLVYRDRRHLVDFKTTKAVPGAWRTWTCPTTRRVIREGQFAYRNKVMACSHCEAGAHETKRIERKGPPRPYGTHLQQVSLYRLLLAENSIEINTAEIVYQDMAAQLRVPVALLPLKEARALAQYRVSLHTQTDLPGILTDADSLWECDWCCVRRVCEVLHGGPVGKEN